MTAKADKSEGDTPEQEINAGALPLNGLVVDDGRVLLQIIERLCGSGDLKAKEARIVGIVFEKLSQSITHSQGDIK